MKSYTSFYSLMIENLDRLTFVRNSHAKNMTDEQWGRLINMDPTIKKVYVQWLAIQAGRHAEFWEDATRTSQDLRDFDRLKARLPVEGRDVSRYRDYRDLYNALQPLRGTQSQKEIKRDAKNEIFKHIRTMYEGPEGKIYVPLSLEASCFLGQNTRWCTASKGNTFFASYNKTGPLYVMVFPDGKRVQAHLSTGQVMDEADSSVKDPKILKSPLMSILVDKIPQSEVQTPSAAATIAKLVGRRVPNIEHMIMKDSAVALKYHAEYFGRKRWPELEKFAGTFGAEQAMGYLEAVQQRVPEMEHHVLTNRELALRYVTKVLNGERFEAAEPTLSKLSMTALPYAIATKQRFLLGEPKIASVEPSAIKYAKEVIKGPFVLDGWTYVDSNWKYHTKPWDWKPV